MGGGAWPLLVGGVICQVYSGNGRDGGGVVDGDAEMHSQSHPRHAAPSRGKHPAITGL